MINKVKFGLFGINCSSGVSLTKHKNRWKGDWKSIVKLVKYCDKNGIDFILPLSQLKDWQVQKDKIIHKVIFVPDRLVNIVCN